MLQEELVLNMLNFCVYDYLITIASVLFDNKKNSKKS